MSFFRSHFLVVAAVFAMAVGAQEAQAYPIYKKISVTGKSYNDILKRWMDREVSIWIGVDGKSRHLVLQVDTGLKPAQITKPYSPRLQKQLEKIVGKAVEWTEVARSNQADTSKDIDCLVDYDNYMSWCDIEGRPRKGSAGFRFFSSNKGQQTDLIIDIVDSQNQFYKAQVHLEPDAVRSLSLDLQSLPQMFDEVASSGNKDNLFK